jgi:plasmid stabilization system protein ParE
VVKRIVWTSRAEQLFTEILEFYYARNGNKIYSRKLFLEVKSTLNHLKSNYYIGKETNVDNTRVIIKGHFKIFYRIEPTEIVILLIWDSRQDPEKLTI